MGQPGAVMHHLSNQKLTQGTETSKYLEEEKTTGRKATDQQWSA
jgi:hypothetical protein